MDASFDLGRPLGHPHLTSGQAAAIARKAGWHIRQPYDSLFGCWSSVAGERNAPACARVGFDVWEIRASNVSMDDPGGAGVFRVRGTPCPPVVYHHLAVIIDDRFASYIQATAY